MNFIKSWPTRDKHEWSQNKNCSGMYVNIIVIMTLYITSTMNRNQWEQIETDETNDLDENLCSRPDVLTTAASATVSEIVMCMFFSMIQFVRVQFMYVLNNITSFPYIISSHSTVSDNLPWLYIIQREREQKVSFTRRSRRIGKLDYSA